MVLRFELTLGVICCGEIAVLAPPDFCAVPIITMVGLPSIGTVTNTGDGGNPPPTKIEDRLPPHTPDTPMLPEALKSDTV